MGPEGNILENSSISTFQQGLTHSAVAKFDIDPWEEDGVISLPASTLSPWQ